MKKSNNTLVKRKKRERVRAEPLVPKMNMTSFPGHRIVIRQAGRHKKYANSYCTLFIKQRAWAHCKIWKA